VSKQISFELPPDVSFEEILGALRAGDPAAWTEAFQRLAVKVIAATQRFFGSEAAQDGLSSAVRTLHRRLKDGQYRLDDWGDLTGLCVRIAWNKCRRDIRKNRAISHENDNVVQRATKGDEPFQEASREEMRQQFRLVVEKVWQSLDEIGRIILAGKLDGLTEAQIRGNLNRNGIQRTERTIRHCWNHGILPQLQTQLKAWATAD
jgi:hypothetical protein